MNRVIVSCMIGNALEWYEFTLYGYFASIIGKLFFPSSNPIVSIIAAFGVFAAGFLMRPLGAIIFGHIGDKMGRKKALLLSIYLMAFPTTAIGLMPTYEDIGWIASVILMLIRLLQGISIGGEFTGSMVFIIEHSKDKERGIAGSYASLSLAIGILLGSATATGIFTFFTEKQIHDWAWRVPFLLSVVGAIIGSVMRRTLTDPKQYLEQKKKKQLHATPVREFFAHHWKTLLHAIGIELLPAVGFYVITIFLITYMKDCLRIDDHSCFIINTLNTCVYGIFIPIAGKLSDRIGRRKVMLSATLFALIFAYPLFLLMKNGIMAAFIAQAILMAMLGFLFGPIPALLVELFPMKVRYTALSMAHSLSMSIFGGTAPLVVLHLIKQSCNLMIPALYIMLSAAISAVALYFYKDRFREPINR